jgi:predicted negative regulator of RcsB-dependent stress response
LSGDPSGAAALFRKTADENPLCGYVAPSLYAAAGCYLSSGQTDEAESVLRKLSAMKGEDDWRQMGMTRLANLLSGGKRYDESILVLSDAKKMLQEKLAAAESSPSPVAASQKEYLQSQIGSLDNQVLQIKKLSGRQ